MDEFAFFFDAEQIAEEAPREEIAVVRRVRLRRAPPVRARPGYRVRYRRPVVLSEIMACGP